MPCNKRQHFVPRHYLRQFRVGDTEQIAALKVSPLQFLGPVSIKYQCQEDYFYGNDGDLDSLLQQSEMDLAPILEAVARDYTLDPASIDALALLAVFLFLRNRKLIETAKQLPLKIGNQAIQDAIERGELPAPNGGYKEEFLNFNGMGALVMGSCLISGWLETKTLACKLLLAPGGQAFVTSDHPVILLNQFFSRAPRERSFAGLGRSGFQMVLPLSPKTCVFFYDPKVYKVGNRRETAFLLSPVDAELVNSLQVQSAEHCLYFHEVGLWPQVKAIVSRFGRLRVPRNAMLRTVEGQQPGEQFDILKLSAIRLPAPWEFCRLLKNPKVGEGLMRDPDWSRKVHHIVRENRAQGAPFSLSSFRSPRPS